MFLGVLLTSCKLFQYSAMYQSALFCLVYIEQRVDYAAIETNLVETASCIFSPGFYPEFHVGSNFLPQFSDVYRYSHLRYTLSGVSLK